jgi:hypothetical protein
VEPQIYISSGTAPAGVSLDDVENAIDVQVLEELKKKFDEWEVTSIDIILSVQNGTVNHVTIKKYDSKTIKKAVLETILRKLKLGAHVNGKIEFTLEYN